MYVRRSTHKSSAFEAIKKETGCPETINGINGQRPLPAIKAPAEPFSVEIIIKELAPFIEKNDLQGALSLIRLHEKDLEKISVPMEEAEEFVRKIIEYNQLLNKIDSSVDHGKFDEAAQLVENNSDLIKNMGTDPKDIKSSIKDMECLYDLVQNIYGLISDGKTEDINTLINANKALLKRLDLSSEYLQELFPEIKIKVSD